MSAFDPFLPLAYSAGRGSTWGNKAEPPHPPRFGPGGALYHIPASSACGTHRIQRGGSKWLGHRIRRCDARRHGRMLKLEVAAFYPLQALIGTVMERAYDAIIAPRIQQVGDRETPCSR